jgi:uncharacterized lipoprotein YmbA
MNHSRFSLLISAALLLTACAGHDARDRYVLGAAIARNVSEQSVRDVSVPNSKAVEATSGTRAVSAVKAFEAGRINAPQQAQAAAGGSN